MVNISNQTLATLLVAAIVISLGGTLISLNRLGGLMPLTGRATTSTANITITDAACIDVTNNIDLGTGTANTSGGILNVSSNFTTNWNESFGFNNCHNNVLAERVCRGLQVQNAGNVDINVSFNISENASTFLGSSSGQLTWTGSAGNASYVYNGCGTPVNNITVTKGAAAYGQWLTPRANLTTPGQLSNQTLCSNLTWETGQDFVTWHINLTVPSDVTTGLHTTTIQFTSSQIS